VRRREFITLLGGTAAAWPIAANAQQPAMPVIGWVGPGESRGDAVSAFRQGLSEVGYVEGQNIVIEYRWAKGRLDLAPDLVADLLRRRVTVIVTPGYTKAALAAKAATATVPIVFGVAEDPVKLGLVPSLARPGGNLTGVNFLNAELVAKRLGLLRDLVPGIARVAVLVNPASGINAETTLRDAEAAAGALGLRIQVLNATTSSEINAAFASLERERPDALFVGGDALFNLRRVPLRKSGGRKCCDAQHCATLLFQ
jgi:putative ABC transport system substrate-binding protein